MPSGLANGDDGGGIFWDLDYTRTIFYLWELYLTVVLMVEQMGHNIIAVFSVGIRSVFLRYYQYQTKENSVGTFRNQKGGSGPLFP